MYVHADVQTIPPVKHIYGPEVDNKETNQNNGDTKR